MPSPLRSRLRAIGAAATPKRDTRPTGLMVYTERRDMPEVLFRLSGTALKRIGWNGRSFDPERCLFLDTETTGLSGGAGTVAFLVGVGWLLREPKPHMVIEQYLMRDYSDEPEQLLQLAERMKGFDCVCTFNGRRFDLPLLASRYTLNRMSHLWTDPQELDLLYPSRRTWKLRLGSCRLGRLEEQVLGMARGEDIPGSEVPQRYFEFLKTGDMSLLDDIIAHNRQDIATLAILLERLCRIHEQPEALKDRKDLFSVGRTLERQGELSAARELYRMTAIPAPAGTLEALTGAHIAGMANRRSYLIARRCRDTESMRELLDRMERRNQFPFEVLIERSKLAEHTDKDYPEALRCARAAVPLCPEEKREALAKRIARLETRTGGEADGIHGRPQSREGRKSGL